MEISITIERKSVLGVVEGISATIGQHNGGEPSFRQLWASDSESPKLDIWWRDGITDLEGSLMKWAVQTTSQFDLQGVGEDLTLTLGVDDRWSDRLTGLLENKVQQYMIHAVVAGWLADFPSVSAPDYKVMAAGDIMSILNILLYRDLAFTESERITDTAKDAGDGSVIAASERATDTAKETGDGSVIAASERVTDTEKSNGNGNAFKGSIRQTDTTKEAVDGSVIAASERATDTEKESGGDNDIAASERATDTEKESGGGNDITASERATDTAKSNGNGNAFDGGGRHSDTAKDAGVGLLVDADEDRDRDDVFKRPGHYDSDVVYFLD